MPVDGDDDRRSGSERHSAHRDDKKRPGEERRGMVKKKVKRGGVTVKPLHEFLSEEPTDEELESSGLDVANAAGQMTQGELQEVADNAPPKLLRLLPQRTQKENEKESWASAAGSVAAESCG